MKIGILMLTYNAPKYVAESIKTLKKTDDTILYELIVVDNRSKWPTRLLLKRLYKQNYIDKLKFNKKNYLFAAGNNIASRLASEDVTHYLLLNSDIRIMSSDWLEKLVSIHPGNGGLVHLGQSCRIQLGRVVIVS